MAVYLCESSLFRVDVTTDPVKETAFVATTDLKLRSRIGCERSAKFLAEIKSSLGSTTGKSTAARLSKDYKEGIVIKFTVNPYPQSGKGLAVGVHPNCNVDADAGSSPLVVKTRIGGKFLKEGLKKYSQPVVIRATIRFASNNDSLQLVSEELRLSTDLAENGYTFNDKVEISTLRDFYTNRLRSFAEVTIELLEGKSRSIEYVAATNKKILDDKIQSDFALIATNDNRIACHSNFLAAHSVVFERMFEGNYKEAKERTFKINMTEEAVNALLKFVYCFDLDAAASSSSISFELLEAAHKYDMSSLENAVELILMGKPNSWYDLGTAMSLFQFTLKIFEYRHLKEKAVKVIQSKPDELRDSTAFQDLFHADSDTAKELFLHCLNK